jgi:hypothetical protein
MEERDRLLLKSKLIRLLRIVVMKWVATLMKVVYKAVYRQKKVIELLSKVMLRTQAGFDELSTINIKCDLISCFQNLNILLVDSERALYKGSFTISHSTPWNAEWVLHYIHD